MVKSEGLSNERFVFWVQTSPNMYTPLKNMSNLNHRYFCSRSISEVHLKMLHLIKKAQYTSSVLHSKLVTNENVNSLLISGESLLVSLSSIEGQSTFTRSLFTNSMKNIWFHEKLTIDQNLNKTSEMKILLPCSMVSSLLKTLQNSWEKDLKIYR